MQMGWVPVMSQSLQNLLIGQLQTLSTTVLLLPSIRFNRRYPPVPSLIIHYRGTKGATRLESLSVLLRTISISVLTSTMPSPYQVSLAALTSAPQQSSAPSAVSTVVPTPAHFGRDLNLPAILLTLLSCLFLLIRIITVHNKQSSLYRRWYETCGILVLVSTCQPLSSIYSL